MADDNDNIIKFPKNDNTKVIPIKCGDDRNHESAARLSYVQKGGWINFEHMLADLMLSVTCGDLVPKGLSIVLVDEDGQTWVFRRKMSRREFAEIAEEYVRSVSD